MMGDPADNWTVTSAEFRLGWNPLRSCREVLREVRNHSWQIAVVFRSEFSSGFRDTVLGWFWAVAMPLVPIGAFLCLKLLRVFPADDLIHPVVYLSLGMVLWLLFQGIVVAPLGALEKYRHVVKSTGFPLIAIFIASYGRVMFDTLVRLLVIGPAVLLLGGINGFGLAMLPLAVLPAMGLFVSLGLMLGIVNVVIPDMRNISDIVFRYLVFISFAIFPLPLDSTVVWWLYTLNPFAIYIDCLRGLIVLGQLPSPAHFAVLSVFSLASLVLATHVYLVLERRILGALR